MTKFATRSLLVLCIAASVAACTQHPAVGITNRAMDAYEINAYNDYLKDVAQMNLEREKAGLAPIPTMGRAEWAGKKL